MGELFWLKAAENNIKWILHSLPCHSLVNIIIIGDMVLVWSGHTLKSGESRTIHKLLPWIMTGWIWSTVLYIFQCSGLFSLITNRQKENSMFRQPNYKPEEFHFVHSQGWLQIRNASHLSAAFLPRTQWLPEVSEGFKLSSQGLSSL